MRQLATNVENTIITVFLYSGLNISRIKSTTGPKKSITAIGKNLHLSISLNSQYLHTLEFSAIIANYKSLAIISILKIGKPSKDLVCLSQKFRLFNMLGE